MGTKVVVCPLAGDWERRKDQYEKTVIQIQETHQVMNQILKHAQHLTKLDALEDIRDSLLSSATGRDHIETKAVILVFKILGLVIFSLLLTLLFLLTGQHFNLISLFKPT